MPYDRDDALAELAALEDPKARAVNERHGDAHGVNLTKMRAVAKRIGTDQGLARQLLGLLICRPRDLSADELDAMVRETGSAKAHDWLVAYVAKKSPLAEEMRLR